MGMLEFCCIISIGPIRLNKIIGYEYYNIHIILFVLMIPALATIMQLQNRFVFFQNGIQSAVSARLSAYV
jgi:hypothetical protein